MGEAMGRVRTREPIREQARLVFEVPEDALPADHPARLLWNVVQTLDLSGFTESAKAVEGRQGRDLLSPRMLLTLWLYAVSQGVGSAREIERRVGSDAAFRWIVGDQRVGRSTLAQFRVGHGEALDALLTDVLGGLLHRGLVSLALVAQDGTRVRASASSPSFRRAASLRACREQADLHVRAVLAQADDPEISERVQRAREAAARDYQRRVEQAIEAVHTLTEQRACDRHLKARRPARASTTDADARVMKMPNGGFGPGYNVQLATAGSALGGPRTIVGVRVTNAGTDARSVAPMLEDIERRTGQLPEVLLADGDHADHESIRAAAARNVCLLVPLPDKSLGPHAARDAPIEAWRARMETDEAKSLYRARASLSELSNAQLKSRLGLAHLLVRGLGKVTSVVLLTVLAHTLLGHALALAS
jgi:transposase